jgi:hypothetical protein
MRTLRVLTALALAALAVAVAPSITSAQTLQEMTITKVVEGPGPDDDFDFELICNSPELEPAGVVGTLEQFALGDGDSVTFNDAELNIYFGAPATCVITELDTLGAESVAVAVESDEGELVEVSSLAPSGDEAAFEFTLFEDDRLSDYEVTVTNVFAAAETTSTTVAPTTTAVAAATATPRFTG